MGQFRYPFDGQLHLKFYMFFVVLQSMCDTKQLRYCLIVQNLWSIKKCIMGDLGREIRNILVHLA